jgi:hypothetical protein
MQHLILPGSHPMKPRGVLLRSMLLLIPVALSAVPLTFTNQHVDIRIVDDPTRIPRVGLGIRDSDTGVIHPPGDVVLEIPPAARNEIPPGFEVFGAVGDPLWILPQSQDPGLPYLGFSAEGLPPGVFESRFEIRLVGVDGPGEFFAWQFDSSFNLALFINSRDGIGPEDRVSPALGSHEHFNLGFTAAGYHQVRFRVVCRLSGSNETVESEDVAIRFGVVPYDLPLEGRPAELTMARWEDGSFHFQLHGTAGAYYRIDTSGTLNAWKPYREIQTNRSGIADIELPGGEDRLFVRAVAR